MSIFKAKFVNVQYKNSNIKKKISKVFYKKFREIILSHLESKYHEQTGVNKVPNAVVPDYGMI